jgi:beta-phosphoglucomutase-like phosphatase (HAD superfamily)
VKYKGIIFDFNGVLLLDKEWQEQAWKEFSAKLRGKPLNEEEMSLHMHGRPNKYVLEYLTGRTLDSEETHRLTQEKESMYRELCLTQGENFKLSPGAKELLDFLVEKNIPHTIATASEITNVRFFFEHLRLARWFDFKKVVLDDGTLPGKPDPTIYLHAAENIGCKPQECIVLEDAKSGIAAAHSANIGKIIAVGSADSHDELRSLPGVTEAITDFTEFNSSLLHSYFFIN